MRLIDADVAVAEADRLFNMFNLAMANADTTREINHIFKRQELFKAVRAVVEKCETVDPVKHSKWKRGQFDIDYCEICGKITYMRTPYCAWCGTKMDQKEEDSHDH